MTATTELVFESICESSSGHESPLLVSHEILREVRLPEAIFLRDIEYELNAGSGLGTFLCPRSEQFPNPNIGELTGGQLIDAVTQMAYCLTGLMIRGGVNLLGLDFENFKTEIHTHRVHAVRTDIAFRHPCLFDKLFSISAQLQRFRNGDFSVLRHNPHRSFVRIELNGTQQCGGEEKTSADLFRAQISACHQLR